MASTPQFKVNQLAKDLGIKTKDITDILKDKGFEAKSQKALEAAEFDVLFEHLTSSNQITNIEDYIDGITYIPSVADGTPKAEVSKEEKPEPAKKQAPKADAPKAGPAKAEPVKADAPKAEPAKKEPAKAEPAKTDAPKAEPAKKEPVKTEPAKAEAPKAEVAKAEAPKAEAPKKEEPKKAEAPKAERPAQQNTQQNAQQPRNNAARNDVRNDNRSDNRNDNRMQGGQRPAQPQRNENRDNRDNRNDRNDNRNGQRQDKPYSNNNNAGQRPAFDRNNASAPQRNDRAPQGQRPQGDRNGDRPQFDRNGDRPQFDRNGDRPQFDRNDRNDRNNQRPGQQNKGKGPERERASQPRDTFQAQPIVRGQGPKKEGTGPRVVDTRGTTVDLSKYDDKLDNIVPESIRDMRGGSERVKKKNTDQRQPQKNNKFQPKKQTVIKKQPIKVAIPDEISVSELASRLKVTAGEVVKRLMMMGMMVTVNEFIDFDTAYLIADELGAEVTKEVVVTIEEKLFDDVQDDESALVERAPVVCVMGHVDHGKTSLLDAIRHTHVTSGEAGGITQHIGAYRVKVQGKDITFLDTPGHEAFTAMRARGAQATDIAILVVAADDGIMPQTVEAINHAKAAGIDIIVAINKMDKPTANPDNILQELTKYELVPEEWGGDVMCVPVSALTGMGINDLLENVLLVAEVKELKANPARRAKGIVIEAKLDKGRGPVATVLVQNGTLRSGDVVIAGTAVGRVRAMTDHNGKVLKSAAPSVPVEITGLAEVPTAGDEFNAVEDEKMARELADQRRDKAKEEVFKANARANLNDLFAQISEGVKVLNIIVKADVGGSAEAVKASLEKISNEEVKVKVIHAAAGGITEGDVMFAAASNAIIVGFNVRPDKGALDSAERQNVDIRTYRVIYSCIEEITAAMKGMLAPKFKETLLGHAEVRQTIHVPNVGTIAGSYIQDGKITRASLIRVLRAGVVVFEDKISSLRRFKDDVREVASGYECGIGLERFSDLKEGDILEAYIMEEIEQ